MRVKAVVSFVGHINGELHPWPVGRVAELPAGVNWLDIGYVVIVEAESDGAVSMETPPAEPPELKANPKPKARAAKTPRSSLAGSSRRGAGED